MMRLRDERVSQISHKFGLLSVARKFRQKEAGDARDKLYALLGLLLQEDRLIIPQYSDDLE
jgi:hypothetical protein